MKNNETNKIEMTDNSKQAEETICAKLITSQIKKKKTHTEDPKIKGIREQGSNVKMRETLGTYSKEFQEAGVAQPHKDMCDSSWCA